MVRKCRSGKALAVTRNKCGSAPAVLARRRCACAGLRDCVIFPVAGFVFLERCPRIQMARKCRSAKALAVTRNKSGSAPAVLARRRCACAGLRDCVVFPVADFVFLERSPGLQMARKCRSGKALAVTRNKCGSAPAVLARRRCACAGLRDCVVFPIAGFVFLERCPGYKWQGNVGRVRRKPPPDKTTPQVARIRRNAPLSGKSQDATASPSSRLFCRFDGWVKYCLSSQRRQVSSPPQQQPVSRA